MRSFSVCIAIVIGLAASAAFAQDYGRPGVYGALNGVASFESFDDTGGLNFDNAIGVSGRIGYRFDQRIAVEGQFEYSGEFEHDPSGIDANATVFTANGKFYVLPDQLQPYLLAGLGFDNFDTNVSDDETGFVVRFGGGVDFYLTENFGLLGEVAYNVTTGDIEDTNYLSLGWGVFYRF